MTRPLVPRPLVVGATRSEELRKASLEWPSLSLTDGQRRDLELLASGAFSPLRSFLGRADLASVVRRGELADGTVWPLEVVLEAPGVLVVPGTNLALRDAEGVMVAALAVEECSQAARAEVGKGPVSRLSGALEVLDSERRHDSGSLRLTPAQWRVRAARLGCERTAALVGSTPLDAGTLARARTVALDLEAHLLVLDLVGAPAAGDSVLRSRVRSDVERVAALGEGAASLVLVPRPSAMDGAPTADVVQATASVLAANYGAVRALTVDSLGAPSARPAGVVAPVGPGGDTPGGREGPAGFTVFLTGLSGAGKSTVAGALAGTLGDMGRMVSLLDGDLVRRHLSSELGFSKEHRDLNVRRIGWVAAEVTKHGGVAVCAPIAPYESVRAEVRAMVEEVGGFLLVYLSTPIEVCEARDRKGLYAKARAGVVKEFTGISDPYEVPTGADVRIDTSMTSPDAAVEVILRALRRRGHLRSS